MDTLLKVGFGKADITPDDIVPLGGYGNSRQRMEGQTVRDPLYATCIAFHSGENTVLLYTTDAIGVYPDMVEAVRDVLCPELNLPRQNVLISAIHSHSTPDVPMTSEPSILSYRKKYVQALCEAGRKAVADLLPSLISVGFAQTEGLNFIRHYKICDGSYAGANFGNINPGVVGHASNNDPWVQVVKIDRVGGKSVILTNFQAHPCFTGGMRGTVVSADYVGELRNYIQTMTGARFAFFQGAAGNHNATSFCQKENRTRDVREYARLLGDYVLRALEAPVQIPGGEVSVCCRTLELELDHSDDHLVDTVTPVWEQWLRDFDRDAANKKARELGFHSIYAVGNVLARAKMEKIDPMHLHTVRVGELAFACAPYEMFAQSGMHIKEYAPYAMTFIVTCCNDGQGYLATELAFRHGCYEVDSRRYGRGTAELLADNFVEMLKEMK